MSYSRLPGAPASPLLGEDTFPSRYGANPRRLVRYVALLVLPLLLFYLTSTTSSLSTSYDPIDDAVAIHTSDDTSLPPAEATAVQQTPKPMEEAVVIEEDVEEEDELALPAPIQWSVEDQQLRRYSWSTPEVHESLERQLAEISTEQRRVRDWLAKTRTTSTGGTPIGLTASEPPSPIRPSPPAERHSEDPRASEGPGLFVAGSMAKYVDLVQEWKTGRPFDVCEKGTWEEEYAVLHAEMLSGAREPQFFEFTCRLGEYCGGIADRLLGMVTTFLYSILSNRAVILQWEQPAPLDILFDSPHLDWSRPFNQSSTTPIRPPYSNSALVEGKLDIPGHNWEEEKIDSFFGGNFVETYGDGKTTPWLQLNFNRGVVIRSFNYTSIRPRLDQLGLKLDTAYTCLLNYLLRPKAAVLAFVAQYTSFFSLPENFVIGLQVRTGDISMYASRKDTPNTVEQHLQYFQCAAQVAETYAHPSQKIVYYLITDSKVLEHSALEAFPDRVVVTGLKASHGEIKTDDLEGMKAIKQKADGFMRTIAESWIFASTDFQILTYRSGFGKIPTWLRGRQGSTIQIFNPHMDPPFTKVVKKKNGGKLPPPLDCSKPESLKSFVEMAQSWSLG